MSRDKSRQTNRKLKSASCRSLPPMHATGTLQCQLLMLYGLRHAQLISCQAPLDGYAPILLIHLNTVRGGKFPEYRDYTWH